MWVSRRAKEKRRRESVAYSDFICVIERVSSHWMRTPISLCLHTSFANQRTNEWTSEPFNSIIACLGLLCGVYSFFVFSVKSAHQTLSTAMNAHFYLIFWAISMRYRAVSNQQLRITSSNLKCMKRVSYYFYYIYSGFIVYYPNTAKRLWWHFYGHMASNTITIKKIPSNDKAHIEWLPRHKSPAIPTNKPIQIILSTPISDKTLE